MLGLVSVATQVTAMSTLIIIQRYAMQDQGHESSAFTLQYYLVGTAFSFGFLLLRSVTWSAGNERSASISTNFDAAAICALVYAATIATALAYNCITFASRRLPSGTVTLYVCLQPLFTGVLSYVALRLPVTVGQVWGALLVCAGLGVTVQFAPGAAASPAAVSTSSSSMYPSERQRQGNVQVSIVCQGVNSA